MSCPRSYKLKRYPLYRAISNRKPETYIAALGCTVAEFHFHMNRQFKDGMRLDNYGCWAVHHIYPASYLDRADDNKSSKYNHWSNLRPIWSEDINLSPDEPDHYADYDTMRTVSPYNTYIDDYGVATVNDRGVSP